ncbi:MAG: hypothetical protein AAFR56_19145 [Chloroflexota bacterium]
MRLATVVVVLAGVMLLPAYAQDTDTLPVLNFEDYVASDRVTRQIPCAQPLTTVWSTSHLPARMKVIL